MVMKLELWEGAGVEQTNMVSKQRVASSGFSLSGVLHPE
jgi:hypothetical protein